MRYFFVLLLSFFSFLSFGQEAQHSQYYKFRVYLKDKGDTGHTLHNPETFLSQRAIERKLKEKVTIDDADLPISNDYFTVVEKSGGKVVSFSKWFSTFVVEVADSLLIGNIESLSFVDSVKFVWRGNKIPLGEKPRPRLSTIESVTPQVHLSASSSYVTHQGITSSDDESAPSQTPQFLSDYGLADAQFRMHNAHIMSDGGFRGKGILVGVIDAGFTNFDVIPSFESVRIGGYRDFVPTGSIFAASDHGTKVLSTMATQLPGVMMGSASEATYWLLRSEDVRSEFPVEEDYWVRAVEFADSVGIDIINTSLGYNNFDDQYLSYTHASLNGNVSLMSKAADMAYDKGMLMVVSAGNEGNKVWGKVTPPADARNVLAIGAAGSDSIIASFSSRGMTADGRIKPDLVSVGLETITIGHDGLIGNTNGTSLSSPFLTGLITSLWSVNPAIQRTELVDIIKRSSDRYHSPDSIYGNGIPDFHIAMQEVLGKLQTYDKDVSHDGWNIRAVSTGAYEVLLSDPAYSTSSYSLRVLDESGNLLYKQSFEKDKMILKVELEKEKFLQCEFLYFVTEEPFKQQIFRIKI